MNSITVFLFFIPTLGLILLGINLIFAPHNAYQEKSSTFECGFHSFLGQNRTQFTISFFVFALLFLVFDLELVLSLPGLISMALITVYGISVMIIFFTILTVGFVFEIGKNALKIDSRQLNNIQKSSNIIELSKQDKKVLFVLLLIATAVLTVAHSVLGIFIARSIFKFRKVLHIYEQSKSYIRSALYLIGTVAIYIIGYYGLFKYLTMPLIESILMCEFITLGLEWSIIFINGNIPDPGGVGGGGPSGSGGGPSGSGGGPNRPGGWPAWTAPFQQWLRGEYRPRLGETEAEYRARKARLANSNARDAQQNGLPVQSAGLVNRFEEIAARNDPQMALQRQHSTGQALSGAGEQVPTASNHNAWEQYGPGYSLRPHGTHFQRIMENDTTYNAGRNSNTMPTRNDNHPRFPRNGTATHERPHPTGDFIRDYNDNCVNVGYPPISEAQLSRPSSPVQENQGKPQWKEYGGSGGPKRPGGPGSGGVS